MDGAIGWGKSAFSTDPATATDTMTTSASASADAKSAEKNKNFNIEGKYKVWLGYFSCDAGCKNIIMGTTSGWFDLKVTAGASALVASAVVATTALFI